MAESDSSQSARRRGRPPKINPVVSAPAAIAAAQVPAIKAGDVAKPGDSVASAPVKPFVPVAKPVAAPAKAAAPKVPAIAPKAAAPAAKPAAVVEKAVAAMAKAPQAVADAVPAIKAPVTKAPAIAKAPAAAVEAGAGVAKKAADKLADAAVATAAKLADAAKTTSSTVTDAMTRTVAAAETAEAEAQPPITAPIDTSPMKTPAAADAADRLKGLFSMATAPAFFTEFNDRAKTAFEKSAKVGEDMVEFTKGNVEALVTSARVAAKGSEAMAQEAAEYSKKSFETATAAFKSFASVKSPTELFQLQSDYAKTSFDSAVAEASKVSEGMLKLMGDMFQPLSTRYAVASEKFKATATPAAPTAL